MLLVTRTESHPSIILLPTVNLTVQIVTHCRNTFIETGINAGWGTLDS